MFINRLFKKSGKIVSLLLGVTMLFATFVPGAFAFNYNGNGTGSGNKALNCNGYSYTQSTKVLKIFFSKQSTTTSEFASSQFIVTRRLDSSNPAFSYSKNSGSGYSGVSDSNLNKGTTVTLTFTNTLATNELYDVTIKAATVADDNLLTLGNYRDRSDFTFTFRTPSSGDTTFSNSDAPVVTYTVGTSNVPYEPNVGVIFDRPVNSTSAATLLSLTDPNGLVANYKKGLNTVVYDDTIDANAVTGAENYKPFANTANTFFFFPETVQGNTNTCYNRDSSGGTTHSYTLDVPPVTDISGNSWTHAQLGTLSFSSESYDQVGWLDNRPTVSGSGDTVTVSWNASGITGANTPAADRYDLYMTTDQFAVPTANDLIYSNINGTSQDVTLPGSGTYYFRVVPKDSTGTHGSAGFSVAGSYTY